MILPKVWGLPTEISLKQENLPGTDAPGVVLRAKIHGSNLEYVECFPLNYSPVLSNAFSGEGSSLVLAYVQNLMEALFMDLRLDFGTEPLRKWVTPREQTQGE